MLSYLFEKCTEFCGGAAQPSLGSRKRLAIGICLFMLAGFNSTFGQSPENSVDQNGFDSIVKPFVAKHCNECHSGEQVEGDLNVDELKNNFTQFAMVSKWEEIVDVLNSHEMPPENREQPNPDDTAKVVDWVTQQMVRAEDANRKSRITMRRLNKTEYQNTIRDLFGIRFEPVAFPQDPSAGGFDNNGEALSLSPMHLELYYQAARQILDRVLVEGEQPPTIKWRFEHEEASGDYNFRNYGDQRVIVHGGQCQKNGSFTVMRRDQWDLKPTAREFVVKHPGEYIVRIRAGGKTATRDEVVRSAEIFYGRRRDQDLQGTPDAYEWAQEQYLKNIAPFKVEPIYEYGPPRLRLNQNLNGQPKTIAEWDVVATIEEPFEYEFRTRLTTDKVGFRIEYAYDIPKLLQNFWFQHENEFARPEVWLDWSELEGPIYESWPPPSHTNLIPQEVPEDSDSQRELAADVISKFMARAFRRPVRNDEIERKLELFNLAIENGDSFVEAIKAPLTAVLISPDFLFLSEPSAGDSKRALDDFEIASRLSYLLWTSQPDGELLKLAADGELRQASVLEGQVDRLLGDIKSQRFTKSFSEQWLGLREIGANPPTPEYFPRYDRHLEVSIKDEAMRFFHTILTEDLSCENFISSDFVVINERLARYYEIPDVNGDHFRKVPVPDTVVRGGLLTQAAMLTITSNGTRTSPVKRGTWVLKNVLGIDPGLPVANAGEIAPKVPGVDKATVRQRLEIHRELPQCARCHNKIDPLGLALENFDASGRWREQEGFGYKGLIQKDDPKINAKAKLPDGTEIDGVRDLQTAIMNRKGQFFRCLAEKLSTYALGRELTLSDRPMIDDAVAHMLKNGESLRLLLKFIVTSDAFLTK